MSTHDFDYIAELITDFKAGVCIHPDVSKTAAVYTSKGNSGVHARSVTDPSGVRIVTKVGGKNRF